MVMMLIWVDVERKIDDMPRLFIGDSLQSILRLRSYIRGCTGGWHGYIENVGGWTLETQLFMDMSGPKTVFTDGIHLSWIWPEKY